MPFPRREGLQRGAVRPRPAPAAVGAVRRATPTLGGALDTATWPRGRQRRWALPRAAAAVRMRIRHTSSPRVLLGDREKKASMLGWRSCWGPCDLQIPNCTCPLRVKYLSSKKLAYFIISQGLTTCKMTKTTCKMTQTTCKMTQTTCKTQIGYVQNSVKVRTKYLTVGLVYFLLNK